VDSAAIAVLPISPEATEVPALRTFPNGTAIRDIGWFPDSDTVAFTELIPKDRMLVQSIHRELGTSVRTIASGRIGESFIIHSSSESSCPLLITSQSQSGGKVVGHNGEKSFPMTSIQPGSLTVSGCANGRIVNSSCSTSNGREFVELLSNRSSAPKRHRIRLPVGTPAAILTGEQNGGVHFVVQDGAAVGLLA
jgi:hypothetical protein